MIPVIWGSWTGQKQEDVLLYMQEDGEHDLTGLNLYNLQKTDSHSLPSTPTIYECHNLFY